MRPLRDDQHGFATLATVGLIGVVMSMALAVALGTALFADHRRAEAAADLAALAGAGAWARGGDACGAAATNATANGARLASCEVIGRDVRVVVAVRRTYAVGLDATLTARARAGPG